MKLTVLAAALLLAALVIADPAAAQRRGRAADAPPPGPAPRDADGRAILWGATPEEKGVWTPMFGITDPIQSGRPDAVSAVGEGALRGTADPRARASHAL